MATFFQILQARKERLLAAQEKVEALQIAVNDHDSDEGRRIQARLDLIDSQIGVIDDEIVQILGTTAANKPAGDAQLARIRATTKELHELNVSSAAAHEIFDNVVSLLEDSGSRDHP